MTLRAEQFPHHSASPTRTALCQAIQQSPEYQAVFLGSYIFRTRSLEATLTFVHACVFVLNHGELIDLAKLLKDGLEILLLQIPGNLPHKQLDGVGLLHWDGVEGTTGYCGG